MNIRSVLTLSAAALVGMAAAVPLAAPASASPSRTGALRSPAIAGYPTTCRGQAATVVQPYEDFIGSDADDVLVVLAPGAEVWTNFGNDLICVYGDANHGAIVHAGPDDDTIVSYSGSNFLAGDGDDDTIVANGGSMEVDGGPGNDIINVGGATRADVYAGEGNDIVNGSPGDDELFGNGGHDLILGWAGDDTLYGDDGNDDLRGGQGWDGHSGGIGWDECQDVDSPVDGGMFGECEAVSVTPAAPDVLAFG